MFKSDIEVMDEMTGGRKWEYQPPPEVGSERWKDSQAFTWLIDHGGGLPKKNCVIQLPNDWGFMAIMYFTGSGHDYFRFTTQEIVTMETEAETNEED